MTETSSDREAQGRLAVGARLRGRRLQQRLTIDEVAEVAKLSRSYISDVERGRRLPTLPCLDALTAALGLLVIDVLEGTYPYGSRQPSHLEHPQDGRANRRVPLE